MALEAMNNTVNAMHSTNSKYIPGATLGSLVVAIARRMTEPDYSPALCWNTYIFYGWDYLRAPSSSSTCMSDSYNHSFSRPQEFFLVITTYINRPAHQKIYTNVVVIGGGATGWNLA